MSQVAVEDGTRASAWATAGKYVGQRASVIPTAAAVVIFVALLLGAQYHFGNFISPLNISALLLDNAFLLILAVGMTFVILTGGIDLSVGSVLGLTGMICAKMLAAGYSPVLVIPVTVGVGAVIGLVIGLLVQVCDVQPFIASLAGLFLARGLTYVVSLQSVRIDRSAVLWLQTQRLALGQWYITPTGILALLAVIIGAFVMLFTRFGRTVYAVGGNENSARLMGLNVPRTKILVYVISGSCGGVAGLLLTAYSGAGIPRNGIGTELDVIAAVVIGGTLLSGGTGYVLGSMIGVFVYGTIKTIISFLGAEQSWTRIIIGALLLVFIVVQRLIVYRSERQT